MHYTVYQITHVPTGKVYIGKHQTEDLNDGYFGSGKLLRYALAKHGKEQFVKTILFDFKTEDEMNAKERELVTEEFCAREDTYNICEGGQGGFSYINRALESDATLREKQRARLSEAMKDMFASTNERRNMHGIHRYYNEHPEERGANFKRLRESGQPHNWTGRSHTIETKQKIGEANRQRQAGQGNSQFGTMWITDGIANRKIKRDDPIPHGWRTGRVKLR